jgi:hypothetical protein
MATSEEAEESDHYATMLTISPVLTVACLSFVTDVTNCLLGVCLFHMNTIHQLTTLSARKTDLIHGEQEEEGDRDNRGRATTAIVLDQVDF